MRRERAAHGVGQAAADGKTPSRAGGEDPPTGAMELRENAVATGLRDARPVECRTFKPLKRAAGGAARRLT